MRKTLLAALGPAVLVAAVAIAAPPTVTGIWLDPSVEYRFDNCSATGSAAQNLPDGKYVMRTFDERINIVFNTTYDGGASNNHPYPPGFGMVISLFANDGGSVTPVSCQSAGGTGDLYFGGTH